MTIWAFHFIPVSASQLHLFSRRSQAVFGDTGWWAKHNLIAPCGCCSRIIRLNLGPHSTLQVTTHISVMSYFCDVDTPLHHTLNPNQKSLTLTIALQPPAPILTAFYLQCFPECSLAVFVFLHVTKLWHHNNMLTCNAELGPTLIMIIQE